MSLTFLPDPQFWRGKRVLLTGHTGFKGSWLALWLSRMGAEVTGLALAPEAKPNLFTQACVQDTLRANRLCDVRDAQTLATYVKSARPQVVLHLAAQALVRTSYVAPLDTYATNVLGTAHLLDALRGLIDVRVAVVVTSDKVYRNREWCFPYREDDALGGHDPYSASKAAAEIVTASYRDAFLANQGVAVASARAGNVIGGGDWAKDRLIPDAIRAWHVGQAVCIRCPASVRPWQHVLEPLAGYLRLAEVLWARPERAGAYNFGPNTNEKVTVKELIVEACDSYGEGVVNFEENITGAHEAQHLALEVSKATDQLGTRPHWTWKQAVNRTMAWYRKSKDGVDARDLCESDINAFEADA